jgi:CRISPR-associated protein Csm5
MNGYLKQYRIVLRTVGPVFVGNGREIAKKEYIFGTRNKVLIPDIQKLYCMMQKRGKAAAFESYLLSGGREDLTTWLRRQDIKSSELKSIVKYELDCTDAVLEKGKTLQILEHMKDPYGAPYIPGTSLKGMFRTIFLCEDIMKNPQKYQREKEAMERELRENNKYQRTNRNTFLKKNIGNIEAINYRTLKNNEEKRKDAVNDWMQGFIVSDSEALSVNDLVLCQKVERHKDGTESTLPLLRECIKPDTQIKFTITIDTSVCDYDVKKIADAVRASIENHYRNFQKEFRGMDIPKTNYLYLGGGSGFVSKTMVYSMYGKQKGIDLTQIIFDKTNVPRIHKHFKDKEYGVSPHILKCTRYQGATLQMGLCKIEKITSLNR